MIPLPRSRLVPRPLVILFAFAILWSALYGSLLWTVTATQLERSDEQHAQHAMIITYLTGPVGAENPLVFLTASERDHMSDVKRLFDAAYLIHLLLIGAALGTAAVLAYQKLWRSIDDLLARSMWWAGWSLIGIMSVAALAAALDFTKFWTLFHVFLFPQGNWLFPVNSTLITLYPSAYFESVTFGIAIRTGVVAALLILLGAFLSRARVAQEAFSERAIARDAPGTSGSSRAGQHPGSAAAPSRARGGLATNRPRSGGRGRGGQGHA